MSRQDRVKEYSDPQRGPHGAGRDEANLKVWADRATKNSYDGPGNSGAADSGKRAEAKRDSNNVGSTFKRGVRRNA
jgi:hypothetical protein